MTNSGPGIWEWQESFPEKQQGNLRADKPVLILIVLVVT